MNIFSKPPERQRKPISWDPKLLHAIEGDIRKAWRAVRRVKVASARPAREVPLNRALRLRLVQLYETRRQKIGGNLVIVTSGEEVPDADFTGEEKKPDLLIRLNTLQVKSTWDALFIECKVVKNERSMGEYGREGILRFVDGRYAWSMNHALMLAYCVKPDVSSRKALNFIESHLQRSHKLRGYRIDRCHWCPSVAHVKRDVVVTALSRKAFKTKRPLGNFNLRHLWLELPD